MANPPPDPLQLGQHFLHDDAILKKIVEAANLKQEDVVFEAGFGQGNLTRKLSPRCSVIAVELDETFTLDLPNVTVIHGNALDIFEIESFNKCVSNIAYHIAEPLLKKLMWKRDCEMAVLLVSASFAHKLTQPGKLGVLTQGIFSVETVTDVPKAAFYPPPDTKSSVIKLVRKSDEEKTPLQKALAALILQHDKKIKNALEKHFEGSITKRQVKEKLSSLGEVVNKGIFSLSEEQFKHLASVLEKMHG